ncbi:sodium-dependent transporter [Bacillus sp. CGMCC 1.16541]|uniref:sodium-dependent transporter n=1 Tax=Bacillus sp. CGMCC 1.16541 TaxID=2185143 RepID=UPI000D736696|nr:sodium-dependent transporter [Bacillus sp. CGMCC 1.16541]
MKKHEQWTSKLGFILAAAGSAIGLGAIWKFPYMTGTNGGGVFLLLFILFTVLIGAPMLLGEFIVGRHTQRDAVRAYQKIAPDGKWHYIGYLGAISAGVILSFYSVIGGWILSYLYRSITGQMIGLSNNQYEELFNSIIANPYEVVIAQFIFMVMAILVVQGGVQKGIERASRIMMPSLFLLFIVLVIRSLSLDGALEGVKFLFQPKFDQVTPDTFITALGQAFFALTVGLSIMVTYSSYLSKEESLVKSASSVVVLNIFISIMAGLVIFPAVFALGFSPDAGPGLIFVVLPAVFDKMIFGSLFLSLFLILLLFATLTSVFSILEILVSVSVKGKQEKRKQATWAAGLITFIIGIPSALSFGVLADVTIFNKTIFDFADYITANIALPLGAFLISIFISLKIPKEVLKEEFSIGSKTLASTFTIWYYCIRFVVPIGIILIFLQIMGIF